MMHPAAAYYAFQFFMHVPGVKEMTVKDFERGYMTYREKHGRMIETRESNASDEKRFIGWVARSLQNLIPG